MPWPLPSFNLDTGIWHPPLAVVPPLGPPHVRTFCNLTPGRRASMLHAAPTLGMWLLCPRVTDIRRGGFVQAPFGSLRWYRVEYVDDAKKCWPNEHRFALLKQWNAAWPTPDLWPNAGPAFVPAGGFRLGLGEVVRAVPEVDVGVRVGLQVNGVRPTHAWGMALGIEVSPGADTIAIGLRLGVHLGGVDHDHEGGMSLGMTVET